EMLKRQLKERVARAIDNVIEKYCPEACVLSDVAVDGALVTNDEAQGYSDKQLVFEKAGSGILRIDAVDAEVAMDLRLPEERRSQIVSILKAKTRFVEPMNLDVQEVSFPESYAEMKATANFESQDPYGLEKLRRMLVMFRDLAGTKEVISTT